jgi:hypothetical protein
MLPSFCPSSSKVEQYVPTGLYKDWLIFNTASENLEAIVKH